MSARLPSFLLVLSFLGVPATALAATRTPLPVLGGCTGRPLIRPSSIDFCGDGNVFATHLLWSRWDGDNATATGIWRQNTCKPFCAGAPYRAYRVVMRLFRPERCDNGRVEFTRVSWRFLRKKPDVPRWSSTIAAPLTPPYVSGFTKCP